MHPTPEHLRDERLRDTTGLGSHLLLDLWGVDRGLLDDVDGLRRRMTEAARHGGATVVDERFHRFSPQGVSGVVVLAESHVAVHTWPEKGFAALDVFTCGLPAMAERIADLLVERFGAERHEIQRLCRGRTRADEGRWGQPGIVAETVAESAAETSAETVAVAE